jgi:hypothetical protein
MKPAWHAWIERWLGVDATFLATASVHVALSWMLAWVLESDWVHPLSLNEDAWMGCIGWVATSAAMLSAWVACGSGRLAVRFVWSVLLALANGFVLGPKVMGLQELISLITGAVALFAAVISLAGGAVLRLARGIRVVRATDATTEASVERWQFRLADLLLFTMVTAIVVAARFWLADFGPLFYEFGSDAGGQILYAIRCGGMQCAVTALVGMLLLLRDRPQIVWTILGGALSTAAAVLLTWLPLDEPAFGSLFSNLRIYGAVAAGSLLATLGTLLPLRAWGWRCVSTNRMPPPNR